MRWNERYFLWRIVGEIFFSVVVFADSEDGATLSPRQISARFGRYGLDQPVHLKYWQDALADESSCKPDVLVVATPNGLHFPSATRASAADSMSMSRSRSRLTEMIFLVS